MSTTGPMCLRRARRQGPHFAVFALSAGFGPIGGGARDRRRGACAAAALAPRVPAIDRLLDRDRRDFPRGESDGRTEAALPAADRGSVSEKLRFRFRAHKSTRPWASASPTGRSALPWWSRAPNGRTAASAASAHAPCAGRWRRPPGACPAAGAATADDYPHGFARADVVRLETDRRRADHGAVALSQPWRPAGEEGRAGSLLLRRHPRHGARAAGAAAAQGHGRIEARLADREP